MKFKIDSRITDKYEGYIDGIVVVKDIDNMGSNKEITNLIRSIEEKIQKSGDFEFVNQHPKIATWREVHRGFGSNPKKFPPSVQSIVRRVKKGGMLPEINKLVDIYNYISLKYVVPAGGEDLDKCEGAIYLTYANGNEEFVELCGEDNDPPNQDEIVYKDDRGVICRKFNWKEADRTKLDITTKNAVLVFECIKPVTKKEIENALEETRKLVLKYCGGKVETYILNKDNLEVNM